MYFGNVSVFSSDDWTELLLFALIISSKDSVNKNGCIGFLRNILSYRQNTLLLIFYVFYILFPESSFLLH